MHTFDANCPTPAVKGRSHVVNGSTKELNKSDMGEGHLIWDCAIVGAGIVGSSLARRLSRLRLRVAVADGAADVGLGASCRNSGVLHSGINYSPGSLRARLCMEGRETFQSWCAEIGLPVETPGKLVTALDARELDGLEALRAQGDANGVSGLRVIGAAEVEALQPGLRAIAALHVPSSAVVSPYAATIAFAEDACLNGVRFFLGRYVRRIREAKGNFVLDTDSGPLRARWVINAAGVVAGDLGRTIDSALPQVYPCRGEYLVLDREVGETLRLLIYPVPQVGSGGLGVHLSPTTEGNILVGPSAEYISSREDYSCTANVLDRLVHEAQEMWPAFPRAKVIGTYAGVRAKLTAPDQGGYADFFIEESPRHPRLVHLLGLESPALSAAPAIARTVVEDIMGAREHFDRKPQEELVPYVWPQRFDSLPENEKQTLVASHPDHGEIVCRCEGVTRHEVLAALGNPLGVETLAGLKYRTRVTMGRCHGGYCLPRLVELLRGERGWPAEKFRLKDARSLLFAGYAKEPRDD